MTAEWLLRALAAGTLLLVAALAAERVAGWLGLARRWTWAAAMAGSLLLPAFALMAPGALPGIALPEHGGLAAAAREASSPATTSLAPATESPGVATHPLRRALGLSWLAASLAMLGCVGWSYRRLDAATSGCVAARVEGTRVLVSDHAGPLVLGVLHPEILLPRWVLEAAPEERRLIVRHEREHVAGGDPWLLALAAAALVLMPWNPALWAQHRRLRLALETDCDARVLAAGVSRRLYGRVLLRTSSHPVSLPSLASAWGERNSHLQRRIVAMTEKPPARRLLRALPLSVLALGVAAAACGVASGPSRGAPPGDALTSTRTGTVGGTEMASREFADGTGMVIARRGRDAAMGYTGLTPAFSERRFVMRDGRRTWRRVEHYPVVVGVDAGSPAEQAGIHEGDVLLALNGVDAREGPPAFGRLRPGMAVVYRVRRAGRELALRLVATSPPPQAWPPSQADFESVHRQAVLAEREKP